MKRNLKQMRSNLKNWAIKEDRKDSDIVNIIYWLYVQRMTELNDSYDFITLYDNLEVSGHTVDLENVEDYNYKENKENYTRYKRTLKNKNDFILLTYYAIDKNDHCYHKETFLKFKYGYDVIFN